MGWNFENSSTFAYGIHVYDSRDISKLICQQQCGMPSSLTRNSPSPSTTERDSRSVVTAPIWQNSYKMFYWQLLFTPLLPLQNTGLIIMSELST